MGADNLVSVGGIILILVLGWGCSVDRRHIPWKVIGWGLFLQFLFALVILRTSLGIAFFRWMNDVIIKLLSFAREGSFFLFGPLALSPGEVGPGGEVSPGFILVFQALPTIVFFSALMAILYYAGIMQKIIRVFSNIFTRVLGTSGAESLCVSSNIFVGIESAFTVRPYLGRMTMSELCTVLTGGMATIASSVMALYVLFLRNEFPQIAGHLISASVLSAPAAIMLSKLLYPEGAEPATRGTAVTASRSTAANAVEAIIQGAQEGVRLCVGVAALLLASLGLLAMFNWGIGKTVFFITRLFGDGISVTLEGILRAVFYPFALAIGVPRVDASTVATLFGERSVLTELYAYKHLAVLIADGTIRNPRSIVLATYGLCGFAHITSLAIFVGGISMLVPQRRADIARVGFRALFAATLACLLTAAVIGVVYTGAGVTILGQY